MFWLWFIEILYKFAYVLVEADRKLISLICLGSQGQQTLGDLLCGYETSRIESSAAGEDLSGASSQLSGVTKMVERQESELSEMPGRITKSCRNNRPM